MPVANTRPGYPNADEGRWALVVNALETHGALLSIEHLGGDRRHLRLVRELPR